MSRQAQFSFKIASSGQMIDRVSDAHRRWCEENGATILVPGHSDYPVRLAELQNFEICPPILSVLGQPVWKRLPLVSVIGTREPTRQSLLWMDTHLSRFIRSSGAVVVSGGARGVDQRAHLLAMRASCPTVVILPSGLATPYPAEWSNWKEEVLASGGAIVSPYDPWQTVRPYLFEARNRLLAAMGDLVFVVEARRRSGSLMTARLAHELNRTLCVLPAHPLESAAAGGLDLLFDGAFPVRDSDDLRALFDASRRDF